MMASHRNSSVVYCEAEKYFGVYAPAGAAAFSLCTIWWTYSAASAGIICRTEPAAVTARVRRMSRRDMDSFMGWPHSNRRKNLTQRTQSPQRRRGKNRNGRGKFRPYKL